MVLCAETSFPLLKPEADWAGGQSLYYLLLHDTPVQKLSPKISLGNHQKESLNGTEGDEWERAAIPLFLTEEAIREI